MTKWPCRRLLVKVEQHIRSGRKKSKGHMICHSKTPLNTKEKENKKRKTRIEMPFWRAQHTGRLVSKLNSHQEYPEMVLQGGFTKNRKQGTLWPLYARTVLTLQEEFAKKKGH